MDEHVLTTYKRTEEIFVRGEGPLLFDAEGQEYLDFLSGIGVTALGHNHPRLVATIARQAGRLMHVSNLLRHEHTEELAQQLCEISGMSAAFFCNSGSEANETALKIARKQQCNAGRPERTAFVALQGSFHGRTLGALSITSNPAYRKPFGPLSAVTFVEPEDAGALEEALAGKPAALIMEPLQGESGLRELSSDYLRAARELCSATDTILIHDEVQCGAGRTGKFLCAQHADVVPDVVTLAKPIAAGLPMGATLVAEGLEQTLVPGDHGSTFGGGPMVSSAARVFLDELTTGGLLANVRDRGAELAAGLDAIAQRFTGITMRRGMGLMQGLVIPGHSAEVCAALYRRGLVACTAGGEVLRFLPPYIITTEHVRRALSLIADACTQILEEQPS